MHVLKKVLEAARAMVYLLMLVSSTLLVVPMFKEVVRTFDCREVTHSGGPGGTYSLYILAHAPGVECYTGYHLQLAVMCVVISPLYMVALMPYAVVAGDADYVRRTDIFSPANWRRNA